MRQTCSPRHGQSDTTTEQRAFTTKFTTCSGKRIQHRLRKHDKSQKKGRRVCMFSSLSQTLFPREAGGMREGTNCLLNGCPKKHCERKLPLPSDFPTEGRSTFSNLSSTLTHTASSHTTRTKAQFMVNQPYSYPRLPLPFHSRDIFNCK